MGVWGWRRRISQSFYLSSPSLFHVQNSLQSGPAIWHTPNWNHPTEEKQNTKKKSNLSPLLHREALPHPEHTQQMPSSFYTNTYLYSSIVPCPKKSTSLEGQNHVPIHFYLIYGVKLIKRLLSSLWLCLHMQFNIYGINELFDIMELIWRVW